MTNSAVKNLGYVLLGAILLGLLFSPAMVRGQISQPTSSFPLPTSTIPEPDPIPEEEPRPTPQPETNPPQIFGSEVPYPYPEPRFNAESTRILYYAATFLTLLGILMLSGTVERILDPFPGSSARTGKKRS